MISPTQLSSVAEAIAANANLAALRSRYTDLQFSECSEDAVSATCILLAAKVDDAD
mgnify:CR=1 FL=1